jgi:hypothetical protein
LELTPESIAGRVSGRRNREYGSKSEAVRIVAELIETEAIAAV